MIAKNQDAVQIIRGPRQCGKSSLIHSISKDFHEISFDDPALRAMAQTNPQELLNQFEGKRLFIDEAQYAPAIFPLLKRRVDLYKRHANAPIETMIRLTGSNQILMDRHVKESLAGRASFFDLNTLSIHEIRAARDISIQEIMYIGGWPELHANPNKDVKKYLDDYINSYIEKDIILAAGIQKQSEFLRFARLLAGRVGQILEYSSLGKDVGVDAKTIKDWVTILERMGVVFLLQPFFSNLSKRLIKSPKIYFIDTGLACRLQGWSSYEPIFTPPQQGALFENLVFQELYKLNINFQLGWQFYFWRSRDGEEIDFVIQKQPNDYLFIDGKLSFQSPANLATYPEVRKVFRSQTPQLYHCIMSGERVHSCNVPISYLHSFMINNVSNR